MSKSTPMSDSTPFLDAHGIRRDHPLLPTHYAIDAHALQTLGLLADLGPPHSAQRHGWMNLLHVHGFEAVLYAVARCSHRVDGCAKVGNAQAQAILDGKLPGGQPVQRHGVYRRGSTLTRPRARNAARTQSEAGQ
jgi:hypothetical protein